MRHTHALDGHAFRLRPIADTDAPFVLALRSDPRLNTWLHPTPPALDAQLSWLARYYDRPGDHYFVVESMASAAPEGLVALYDIEVDADPATRCGEWGRWILRHGSLAAVESAWLIYRCAFERLALAQVCCRTVAANRAVVSFHDSCGIPQRRVLPGHFDFGGERHDAIEHRVERSDWARIGPPLDALARRLARRLGHG